MAHICGVVAALLPLILIPSDNPLITLSFAMNCAHLYSVHALYRRFLKHWDVYDKWLLGQLEELPPSTMRIKPLLESDLVVAQHLVCSFIPHLHFPLSVTMNTPLLRVVPHFFLFPLLCSWTAGGEGLFCCFVASCEFTHAFGRQPALCNAVFVDLTVRRPLASLTAAEKQGYVLSRLQTAAYVVPWLLISWLLLPTMASDYMHAACCSSLGKAVQQLPFAHEPLCHSHTHCMDLPRASTDNLARPHLSTVAAAFVDAADNAIANAPSFVLTLAPALASGLSLLMMLEIVAAISWFVSCFKVIEAINTLLHACMGYTVHSLLGNVRACMCPSLFGVCVCVCVCPCWPVPVSLFEV